MNEPIVKEGLIISDTQGMLAVQIKSEPIDNYFEGCGEQLITGIKEDPCLDPVYEIKQEVNEELDLQLKEEVIQNEHVVDSVNCCKTELDIMDEQLYFKEEIIYSKEIRYIPHAPDSYAADPLLLSYNKIVNKLTSDLDSTLPDNVEERSSMNSESSLHGMESLQDVCETTSKELEKESPPTTSKELEKESPPTTSKELEKESPPTTSKELEKESQSTISKQLEKKTLTTASKELTKKPLRTYSKKLDQETQQTTSKDLDKETLPTVSKVLDKETRLTTSKILDKETRLTTFQILEKYTRPTHSKDLHKRKQLIISKELDSKSQRAKSNVCHIILHKTYSMNLTSTLDEAYPLLDGSRIQPCIDLEKKIFPQDTVNPETTLDSLEMTMHKNHNLTSRLQESRPPIQSRKQNPPAGNYQVPLKYTKTYRNGKMTSFELKQKVQSLMEQEPIRTKNRCFAPGCTAVNGDNTNFFYLPGNLERTQEWLRRVGINCSLEEARPLSRRKVLCSRHFGDDMYLTPKKKKLISTAVPFPLYHGNSEDVGSINES